MTTYTIAYDAEADLLIACAPDGAPLEDRVQKYLDESYGPDEGPAEVEYHHGLTLTDDLLDGDVPVYAGSDRGYLTDAENTVYLFAVHRPAT